MSDYSRIVQFHSRYSSSSISGENSSVVAIFSEMENETNVESFQISTQELLNSKLKAIFFGLRYLFVSSGPTKRKFQSCAIFIHNTIPFFSAKYLEKLSARNRLIFFWHNNRRFCIKGTNFRNGQFCNLCAKDGRYFRGVIYRCYRESFLQSLVIYFSERNFRKLIRFNNVSHVVFSGYNKNLLISNGIEDKSIHVIPHFYSGDISKKRIKSSKNIDFIAVGRLDREKGFYELILAWNQVDMSIKGNSTLHIIGDGEDYENIRNLIVDNSVVLHGKQNAIQTRRIAQKCRAGIVPSQCPESFGKTVLEFYSVGLPVIATPSGSLVELVGLLDSKLVCDSIEAKSMAQKIEEFILAAPEYFDLPQQIVEKNFSRKIWADKMRILLQ